MKELTLVKIWEICAVDPKAGLWILRNLHAGQVYDLTTIIDEQFYVNFLLAEVNYNIHGRDLVKAYQEVDADIEKHIEAIYTVLKSTRSRIATLGGSNADLLPDRVLC